jgi:hypothetical protein
MADSANGTSTIFNEQERRAIHQQLDRLLMSSPFRHSRRFPAFLRFVVERTLSGQTDSLKERTLGVGIFGKSGDYDTVSDPIVRVTAAEIRKRIAQYYQEPGHENELRISLRPGSYIPQFDWQQKATEKEPGTSVVVASPATEVHPSIEKPAKPRRPYSRPILVAACLVVLALCAATAFLWKSRRSTFDPFWGGVLRTSDPVLFCVGDQNEYSTILLRDAADPTSQTLLKDHLTAIIIDDVNPIIQVAGLLQSSGKKYSLKGEGVTDLTDLRNGPTIFVGAFDNAWTLRLTKSLRYHFANNPEMTEFGIVDSTDPARPRWVINRLQQMTTNNYRDFAIVACFTDSTTGQLAIVAAGVGRGGTRVAGEFLTEPANLAQLQRAAAREVNKKNIEVVLSTQIIDGQPGTPKVEASYFW